VEQTLVEEVNRNWSHTPLYVRQNAHSKIKVKLFQRVLWAGKLPIQVAQTNFTYLSNPKDKVDLKQLSETIVRSFPKGILRARPISNGYRLEGEWKDINRMLKIDILKKNNDFMTVTTLYRPSIAKAFNKELEVFHSLLKTYEETAVVKTSYINFLINDANAAPPIPTLDSLTTLLTTPNPTTGTTPLSNLQAAVGTGGGITPGFGTLTDTGLTNVGTGMTDAGTGMTNLGTGMTNLGTAVAPLAVSLDRNATATGELAAAVKDGNRVATEQGNQANQTALTISREANETLNRVSSEANATINRQGDAFNKNYAETNRIAALALDPNHMAKLAYYTAAGAALGSLTVNLAVEGIAAGFSFLKEFFTGAKEKALDWEKFQKATATWDSQVAGLVNYEKVVDDLIKSFEFFQDENLDNDYLTNLQKTKIEMKFDEKEELALSEDKDLSKECRFKHYEIADFLHNKIDDYEKILKFAKDQHIKIDDNQKYFCQQLSELKQRILQAEQQMADIRFAILKAERQFYDKATETIEQRQDDVEKVNSQLARTIKAQQSFDKESTEQIVDFEDKVHDDWHVSIDRIMKEKKSKKNAWPL